MTIMDAVRQVMRRTGSPMSPADVLLAIQVEALYPFKAKDALGVVRSQMRRHAEGYDRPVAAAVPCLRRVGKDLYVLL